jgi:LysR family glycine cleavage system transcriptional activator
MPTSELPPLAAIRVFEAAARHLSFTRAAAELGMTQAAVSYQIKILEERVGAPLFLRLPRQVKLTKTGAGLAPAVSDAFEQLRVAYAGARGAGRATLVITTVLTFASNWLSRHLGSFQIANPDIAVRLDTTSRMWILRARRSTSPYAPVRANGPASLRISSSPRTSRRCSARNSPHA